MTETGQPLSATRIELLAGDGSRRENLWESREAWGALGETGAGTQQVSWCSQLCQRPAWGDVAGSWAPGHAPVQ